MPTYRRADDQEIWYWCRNCSNWPFYDYEEIYDKPDSEHFCDECKKKEKEGKCRK